jgi:hypothetical protein
MLSEGRSLGRLLRISLGPILGEEEWFVDIDALYE